MSPPPRLDHGDVVPPALAEEAATWFVRMRQPRVGEHERQRFRRWLATSDKHQREYACFEKLWGALDSVPPQRRRKKRLAAGAGLCIAALAALLQLTTGDSIDQTGIGETRHLALSDGSTVDLDADSRLRIEYTPWRRRITVQQGQALFKVAPGIRPFEVVAGHGRLRDIGTTFNVLEDQGKVTVSVAEGAVEINLDHSERKWLLSAGRQASYGADDVYATRQISPQEAESWLQNRWRFEDASLGEVARQINRQHERPVLLGDASLDRYRVSGVFERQDRAGLLKALCTILPIKLEEGPDGTRLRRR
jgi:transmembrane sensor